MLLVLIGKVQNLRKHGVNKGSLQILHLEMILSKKVKIIVAMVANVWYNEL